MSQQIAFPKIVVSSSIDLSYLDDCCIDTLNSITSSWIIADDYLETSINHKGGSQIKDYITNLLYKIKGLATDSINLHKHLTLFNQSIASLEEFKQRWIQVIWLSYRSGFKPITNSKGKQYTSDTGWGCTIRAAQMIVAEALQRTTTLQREEILAMFLETEKSLFSMPNIINIAQTKYKIDAGEWLCPSVAVSILAQLMLKRDFSELDIRVFNEGVLYLDKLNTVINEGWVRPNVADIKSNNEMDETSLLIFVAYRLGMKNVDPIYYDAILNIFKAPCCIGFVGGKPDKAFYFVGANGDKLIYLDPHYVQVYI